MSRYLFNCSSKEWNVGLLRLILSHVFDMGANLNGQKVLQSAVARGRKECVQIFLEHGMTSQLERLFRTAIVGGHEDIVRLLLEHGAVYETHNALCIPLCYAMLQ